MTAVLAGAVLAAIVAAVAYRVRALTLDGALAEIDQIQRDVRVRGCAHARTYARAPTSQKTNTTDTST